MAGDFRQEATKMNTKMIPKAAMRVGVITILIVFFSNLAAQNVEATLFKEAIDVLEAAKQASADILSPTNFLTSLSN